MFLSLKGALGRNPMLNRVGQKLLQSFGGAAAAYSLRNLASNIASVVRVRRASDNSEKDFSAEDISSGAMTEWVNAQIVPPLDIRELDANGERTGALVEAAAAYSLRNLSASYTGNVVDVRRSSDNAEESFTAAEVADGTLTDWVNTDNLIYTSNFSTSSRDGWDTSSCTAVSNIDEDADGTGQPPSDNWLRISANDRISIRDNDPLMDDIRLLGGGTYKIEVDYYAPVSISNHRAIAFTTAGNPASQAINFSAGSGTRTYVLVITDAQVSGLNDLRIGSTNTFATGTLLYLKNIRISKTDANGFVSQWYDQSGNAKHATQGTDASQPKIVDGGSLVSGGLDFDGVDDRFSVPDPMTNAQGLSLFIAANITDGQGTSTIVKHGQGNPDNAWNLQISSDSRNPLGLIRCSNGTINTGSTEKYITSGGAVDKFGTMALYGANHKDGVGREIIVNGTSLSLSRPYGNDQGTTFNSTGLVSVGANADGASAINGTFAEIIIYDSDQSDNRTAIEANIGDHYDIDLPSGVDTGYDQVDGFVETWYDQSGNGNDAVQQVSGSQPKIVDAGVLVSGGLDFDGVNDTLVVAGNPVITANYAGTYSAFSVQTIATSVAGYIAGNASPTNGSSVLALATSVFTLSSRNNANFDNISRAAGRNLLSACYNNGDASLLVNGGGSMVDAGAYDFGAGTSDFRIGSRNPSNVFLEGKIEEVIIYNSDQSANREAIEANINNQYDIY